MKWNKEEEEILFKLNARGDLIIDEVVKIFPYRTENGIRLKIRAMKLPYRQTMVERSINYEYLTELYEIADTEIKEI